MTLTMKVTVISGSTVNARAAGSAVSQTAFSGPAMAGVSRSSTLETHMRPNKAACEAALPDALAIPGDGSGRTRIPRHTIARFHRTFRTN